MERGDLRYAILDLLKDGPSYGYELFQALEEPFHGLYSPSAGTVFPTLQSLQDLGYVSVAEQDGRKMYTITDGGRRFLAERQEKVKEVWERMGACWGGPPMHGASAEFEAFHSADPSPPGLDTALERLHARLADRDPAP